MPSCPVCGKPYEGNPVSCPNCGKSLAGAPAPGVTAGAPTPIVAGKPAPVTTGKPAPVSTGTKDWSTIFTGITLGLFAAVLLAGIRFILYPNPIAVALLFGITGGIAHEIVQSGGTVLVPKPVDGGDVNLGTLTGAVLGVVSGFLVLHGVDLSVLTTSSMLTIAFEALTAGLALKGIADVDPKRTSSS